MGVRGFRQLVQIKCEDFPPEKLLHPNRYNLMRSVAIRNAMNIFHRSVHKIFILPIDTEDK